MVEHVRSQSGRCTVTSLTNTALERLPGVVRLDVDFQMIAVKPNINQLLIEFD